MKLSGDISFSDASHLVVSSVEESVRNEGVKKNGLSEAEQLDELAGREEAGLVDQERLLNSLERVNRYAAVQEVSLRLEQDEELGQFVVNVVDKDTGEAIRQIPSEHALELAKRIEESMGLLFDGKEDLALNLLDDQV